MYPLFVSIDVSSKNNVVCLMQPDGTTYSTLSVQNNLGGARILSEKIISALAKLRLQEVTIGMEATSIYGDSLVYALREDGALGRYQRHIHVLNPKQVRKFKDAYPDLPKNDFPGKKPPLKCQRRLANFLNRPDCGGTPPFWLRRRGHSPHCGACHRPGRWPPASSASRG